MSMRKRARTMSMATEMEQSTKRVESQQEQQFDHHHQVASQEERQFDHHHQVVSFLKACGLCKSPFLPENDIYIYKGEIAFCNIACREVLIKYDEWKEKCSLSSAKNKAQALFSATGPETSDNKGKNVDIGTPK